MAVEFDPNDLDELEIEEELDDFQKFLKEFATPISMLLRENPLFGDLLAHLQLRMAKQLKYAQQGVSDTVLNPEFSENSATRYVAYNAGNADAYREIVTDLADILNTQPTKEG